MNDYCKHIKTKYYYRLRWYDEGFQTRNFSNHDAMQNFMRSIEDCIPHYEKLRNR